MKFLGRASRSGGGFDGRPRLDRARRTAYALPGLRLDLLGGPSRRHRRKVHDHVHDIAGAHRESREVVALRQLLANELMNISEQVKDIFPLLKVWKSLSITSLGIAGGSPAPALLQRVR